MKLQPLLLGLSAPLAFQSVHAASNGNATPHRPIPTNAPKTWVHPGVFVSGPQLDYIAKKIKARKDPWKEALDSMLDTSLMSPTRTAEPYETVECGPTSTPNIGCYQEREDSMAANPVNDIPILALIGDQSVTENANLSIALSASDVDVGDMLSFSVVGLPTGAVLTDNGDGTGSIDWMTDFGEAGTYSLTVTVSDNGVPVLTDDETFDIEVGGTNQAPTPSTPTTVMLEDNAPPTGVTVLDLLAGSMDPDGDPISIAGITISGDERSALSIQATNDILVRPSAYDSLQAGDSNVTITVDFFITDGSLSTPGTVDIIISGANDAPRVEEAATKTIEEGATPNTVMGDLRTDAVIVDIDSDPVGYSFDPLMGSPGMYGTLDLSGTGEFTYTINN